MQINLIVGDDIKKNKVYINKFMNSKFIENKLLNINDRFIKYSDWCFKFEDLNYIYKFYNIQDLSQENNTIDKNIKFMNDILSNISSSDICSNIILYFYAIPYSYINEILKNNNKIKFNIIYL